MYSKTVDIHRLKWIRSLMPNLKTHAIKLSEAQKDLIEMQIPPAKIFFSQRDKGQTDETNKEREKERKIIWSTENIKLSQKL